MHTITIYNVLTTNCLLESQRKEAELLDGHYRRDFVTCDNQLLNGEMFLQVCTNKSTQVMSISIYVFRH